MSKVVNTYWDNGRTVSGSGSQRQARSARRPGRLMPRWFVVGISIMLSSLIVITLNFRAWTNAQHEYQLNQQLNTEIEQLTTQNSSMQEEIKRLQTDPKTIEREARKLGMGRPNDQVFVPTQ